MATFYSEVESNILKTWVYLILMSLFVVGMGYLFSVYFGDYLFFWIAIFLSIVFSFSSYFYSDKIILRMSSAKEIKKEDAPELYRVVENLSISQGLPMPKIVVIEDLHPNAFATGRNPQNSVIGVTRGLLDMMEKSELEAVVAHELSHIKNRDILLSTVVVVLAMAVTFLSRIFTRSAMFGGGGRREGGGLVIILIAILVAILTPIISTIIRLAISRKREHLADASAVLMTRHPDSLARALIKIKEYPYSMKSANDATAHLYVVNPFRGKDGQSWFHKLFSTHPPLEERIKRIKNIDR